MAGSSPYPFISYRRNDAAGTAGRLGDWFAKAKGYGDKRLFRDVAIPASEPFEKYIESALDNCNLLLAVIGRDWASEQNLARLKDDEVKDFVRFEIATALARRIPVIPVCVDEAELPDASTLPSDIRPLVARQAVFVNNRSFESDFEKLLGKIARLSLPDPRTIGGRVSPRDGLSYVEIPPGSFRMGKVPDDETQAADEEPRHEVTISTGFYLSQLPVSVAAYLQFAKELRLDRPQPPTFNGSWARVDHPIVRVSWERAAEYCAWAGGRLPTEAEWEYAARGGRDGLKYPYGKALPKHKAKYRVRTRRTKKFTEPADAYPVNGFGLIHTVGNVWEWVADWYDPEEYSRRETRASRTDPTGPTSGPGDRRVARGGSWNDKVDQLRTSNRLALPPETECSAVGFRCLLELDQLP